jgi:hypothetical protein
MQMTGDSIIRRNPSTIRDVRSRDCGVCCDCSHSLDEVIVLRGKGSLVVNKQKPVSVSYLFISGDNIMIKTY